MKLPKRIVLNPITYEVKTVQRLLGKDDTTKLYGAINYSECTIEVEEDIDPQMQRLTVLHEVLHGLIRKSGHEDAINPQRMEGFIEATAAGLVAAFKDNPDLIKMIEEMP